MQRLRLSRAQALSQSSPALFQNPVNYLLAHYLFLNPVNYLPVHYVFAVPGDFNLTLLDYLVAKPGLSLVGCCNELNAGYAADGYVRSRCVGACAVMLTRASLIGLVAYGRAHGRASTSPSSGSSSSARLHGFHAGAAADHGAPGARTTSARTRSCTWSTWWPTTRRRRWPLAIWNLDNARALRSGRHLGKGGPPQTSALADWMDSPELGPICDLLVSYVRFVKDGVRAQCVEAARAST